jgi:uncharacterized membrane protein
MRLIPRVKVKKVIPSLLELCGVGMIVGGIWFLSPIVSIIVGGVILVFIAQGLSEGRADQ